MHIGRGCPRNALRGARGCNRQLARRWWQCSGDSAGRAREVCRLVRTPRPCVLGDERIPSPAASRRRPVAANPFWTRTVPLSRRIDSVPPSLPRAVGVLQSVVERLEGGHLWPGQTRVRFRAPQEHRGIELHAGGFSMTPSLTPSLASQAASAAASIAGSFAAGM